MAKDLNKSMLEQTLNLMELMERFDEVDSGDDLFKEDIKQSLIEKIFEKENSLAKKTDNIINFIDAAESHAAQAKTMKDRFAKRQKTLENLVASTKKYIIYIAEKTSQKKFEGDFGSVNVVASPVSLEVSIDLASTSVSNVVLEKYLERIPEKYLIKKTCYCLDKELLKKDMQAGYECDFAQLKNSSHVRIK